MDQAGDGPGWPGMVNIQWQGGTMSAKREALCDFFSSCMSFDFTCIGYKISSTFYNVILVINRRHYMQRRPNMLTGPLKSIAPNKLCELDKD